LERGEEVGRTEEKNNPRGRMGSKTTGDKKEGPMKREQHKTEELKYLSAEGEVALRGRLYQIRSGVYHFRENSHQGRSIVQVLDKIGESRKNYRSSIVKGKVQRLEVSG